MTIIREATRADIPLLYELYNSIGKKHAGYFEQVFDENITVLIAQRGGQEAGFCLFNETPRYNLYRKLKIPEIQDLNVVPQVRRHGVATSLIKHCEELARSRGYTDMGISVGLFKDYGPAQVLYVKLGYIPDGNGITCDREGVKPYTSYIVDDDLCLMMIKPL